MHVLRNIYFLRQVAQSGSCASEEVESGEETDDEDQGATGTCSDSNESGDDEESQSRKDTTKFERPKNESTSERKVAPLRLLVTLLNTGCNYLFNVRILRSCNVDAETAD